MPIAAIIFGVLIGGFIGWLIGEQLVFIAVGAIIGGYLGARSMGQSSSSYHGGHNDDWDGGDGGNGGGD